MFNTREKKERSLLTKLFLKPHRCSSPKCVTVRRQNRPGFHGARPRKSLSEFGQQLREKQKIRFTYGVRESYMKKLFGKALKDPSASGEMFMKLLERRLDNALYRLGLAPSRSVARQLVGHGHILVNQKKVTIPSYQIKVNDVISIRPQSINHPAFKELSGFLKQYEPPVWFVLDREKLEGRVISLPKDFEIIFDLNLLVDYYSNKIKSH